jgi:hypothetical protein
MATKTGIAVHSEDKLFAHSLNTPSTNDIQLGYSAVKRKDGRFAAWLKTLSIETGGIERVTDAERAENTSKVWHACTFWYDHWLLRMLILHRDLSQTTSFTTVCLLPSG